MTEKRYDHTPPGLEEVNYDELMKEFKEDQKYENFSIPEQWDQEFRQTIEKTLRKKNRIKCLRNLAVAACLVLVVGVCGSWWSYQVYGTNVCEFFSTTFEEGNIIHAIIGTDPELSINITNDSEAIDIIYNGETLDEILENIRAERKYPILVFADIFDDYKIIEAKYSQIFKLLTIKLQTEQGTIYISQDNLYENTGSGVCFENEIVSTVYNENLNMDITIYKIIKEANYQAYGFTIILDSCLFTFDGVVEIKDCEEFAKSIRLE